MSEKPNPCNLKLVLLFDPQDESCSICSHNLTAEDASQKLDELGDEGLLAVTLDQPSHHAAYNPDDCTTCRAELLPPLHSGWRVFTPPAVQPTHKGPK